MRSQRRRRRLSMTSLIDVIFLLLLFFMLSSTFSRFAEVELAPAAASANAASASDQAPLFLRLRAGGLDLNGQDTALNDLATALAGEENPLVLVSLQGDVSAQRLTDLLVALRSIKGARVTVLGGA